MSSDRARVLWGTEEPPDRGGGGGNIRQSHLLEALGHRVDVELVLVGELRDAAVASAVTKVTELFHPPLWSPGRGLRRRAVSLADALVGRLPAELRPAARARQLLAAALAERHRDADLVIVEHEAMAPVLAGTRAAPWVIQFQHVLSEMLAQSAASAPGPRQRWLYQREAAKARRLERWAATSYDRVVVCSEEDERLLRDRGATEILVVPNGVDLSRFEPSPVPEAARLVLPGTLSFAPNVDGARWFCDEVFDLVRAACPGVQLELVGREPVAEVLALGERDGITVHADVPSILPHLAAARVVVVPLRIGTGTRLKALEAMAARRPVVGTSIGLEGLGVIDGVHARVADDPAAFARSIIDLLEDLGAAESIAAAGRALVEQRFGWDRIGASYADEIAALAAPGRPVR